MMYVISIMSISSASMSIVSISSMSVIGNCCDCHCYCYEGPRELANMLRMFISMLICLSQESLQTFCGLVV